MSFDQVFSQYVTALNKFYTEQDQLAYDALAVARKAMQDRDAKMLDALKALSESSDVAKQVLKDIGE